MPDLTISQALELALAHHRSGRVSEAEGIYRQILTAFPEQPDALHWLGVVARQCGNLNDSHSLIARSLELQPCDPLTHSDMGETLREMGQLEAAAEHYRIGISLRPTLFSLHNDLGIVYRHLRRFDEAIACFNEALRLGGDVAAVYMNLGSTLVDIGRLDEALTALDQSLQVRPNDTQTLLCKANALLLKGDLEHGLPLYENRLGNPEIPYPKFTQPAWDGSDITGKTLAVVAEQGLGDTIMFARYLPILAKRGIRAMLFCAVELQRLMRSVGDGIPVFSTGQSAPLFDFHVPLLSLPYRLGTTIATIPGDVPYLRIDDASRDKWREKLSRWNQTLKVGLVWAGSKRHKGDKRRSLGLSQLAPLASVPGVIFFSLQKGAGSEQTAQPPAGINLIDLAPDLADFTETAGAIEALDLTISVDTSVVHLAGALGRPVWTLLASPPDWRWMCERADSPWYPTMRLFRQAKPGDWGPVLFDVTRSLTEFAAQRAARRSRVIPSAETFRL